MLFEAAPYVTLANTPDEPSVFEIEEKKSRFIGRACHVENEEQAREFVARVRALEHGARHNVFAFLACGGPANAGTVPVERQSDDGEPQKTAGLPVLEVIRGAELKDVAVVVTRYFGGTLLGAGGLVRAYAHSAKLGLDAAGRSIKQVWTRVLLPCPYSWYERIKLEIPAFGGVIDQTDFGAEVTLELLLPKKQAEPFLSRIFDLSSGTIEGLPGEDEYRAFPVGQET